MYHIGQRFFYDGGQHEYILASTQPRYVGLINIKTGLKWGIAVRPVFDPYNISLDELKECMTGAANAFTGPNYPPVQEPVVETSVYGHEFSEFLKKVGCIVDMPSNFVLEKGGGERIQLTLREDKTVTFELFDKPEN